MRRRPRPPARNKQSFSPSTSSSLYGEDGLSDVCPAREKGEGGRGKGWSRQKGKRNEGLALAILATFRGVGSKTRGISRGTCHASTGAMAKLTSYRELIVWQKSMNLAERCYHRGCQEFRV